MTYPVSKATVPTPAAGEPLRVVQITDTHLGRREGGRLLGVDTDQSLAEVLKLVAARDSVDLILATGDLADDGSIEAYRRLRSLLRGFPSPVYCLPGNHDQRDQLEAVLTAGEPLVNVIEAGTWQLVLLDSQLPGEVGGKLGTQQLDALAHILEQASARSQHVLLCLHHHPVPVGSAWLDEQIVADADRLFEMVAQCSGVRGMLWGHVHQVIETTRDGVKLMSSPSTCVQFEPDSERFRASDLSPGYRWLDLYPDGRIETGVERVSGVSFDVDLDSTGYL